MGYKVKWVEENLGVSRKALRNFEKHGLMPANEGGAYRDYSDEDIERICPIGQQYVPEIKYRIFLRLY